VTWAVTKHCDSRSGIQLNVMGDLRDAAAAPLQSILIQTIQVDLICPMSWW
jgi:hypothetical protein